jgi:nucleotide-binding universal stress UspA family protein
MSGMKLLLGIGGSDDSTRALERTVERVAETGDDLTVAILRNPATEVDPTTIEERTQTVLDEADMAAPVRHLDGDPGSQLVDLAEREGFDRIVLGGGETSPMGKIKLGGIAEFVLLNSHVSVTLVR